MQSDRKIFGRDDVVLDSFYMAFRDKDNIFYKLNEKQIFSKFVTK